MSEKVVLTASAEDSGSRIDKYISDNIAELTRSAVQGLTLQNFNFLLSD